MRDEIIGYFIGRWDATLRKYGEQLTAQMLVKPWVTGLREFGTNVNLAKVWTRGFKSSYPTEMPFVLELDCPFSHRTPDRRLRAKVRLIVEDDGWVTLDDESSCEECDQSALEEWLLTCPRCEAGDENVWHRLHADDEHRHGRLTRTGEEGIVGSVSPLSFVICEFNRLRNLAEARWWTEHTEDAIADYRAVEWYEDWTNSGEGIEEDIKRKIETSGHLLRKNATATTRPVPSLRSSWTDEKAEAWLDLQKTEGGELLIPIGASQRDAWNSAESIEGHPPKNRVERAQTIRKNRPA